MEHKEHKQRGASPALCASRACLYLPRTRLDRAEPAIGSGAKEVGTHVARNEVFHVEHQERGAPAPPFLHREQVCISQELG